MFPIARKNSYRCSTILRQPSRWIRLFHPFVGPTWKFDAARCGPSAASWIIHSCWPFNFPRKSFGGNFSPVASPPRLIDPAAVVNWSSLAKTGLFMKINSPSFIVIMCLHCVYCGIVASWIIGSPPLMNYGTVESCRDTRRVVCWDFLTTCASLWIIHWIFSWIYRVFRNLSDPLREVIVRLKLMKKSYINICSICLCLWDVMNFLF